MLCDLYFMSGYTPPARAGATVAEQETERDREWKILEKTMTQIPRKCVLVSGLDANRKMGKALPCVGTKGDKAKYQRNSDAWNDAGRRMLKTTQACDLRAATAGSDAWTWCHPTGTKSRSDCILVRARTALGGSKILYGSVLPFGGNRDHQPLQCNVDLTLTYGAARQQLSRTMWNRGHLTEACKAVHELRYLSEVTSRHRIGGLVRREQCHISAFGSGGMVRSTSAAEDHVEAEQQVRNLESHLVKCLCDKEFADQPRRQKKGNIKHALKAETPQFVREKQIFLSKLPSDRRTHKKRNRNKEEW